MVRASKTLLRVDLLLQVNYRSMFLCAVKLWLVLDAKRSYELFSLRRSLNRYETPM